MLRSEVTVWVGAGVRVGLFSPEKLPSPLGSGRQGSSHTRDSRIRGAVVMRFGSKVRCCASSLNRGAESKRIAAERYIHYDQENPTKPSKNNPKNTERRGLSSAKCALGKPRALPP